KLVEQLFERLRRQVLVIVGVDLHHRGVDARAQALDLDPRELAVGGNVVLLADAPPADRLEVLGAAQHARRGAAQLDISAPDRFATAGSQPPHGGAARHSSGMMAEACRPGGYFAISALVQATFSAVKAKVFGWTSGVARRRTLIGPPRHCAFRLRHARLYAGH